MPVPDKDLQQHDKKRRHNKNIADCNCHKRKSRRRYNDPSAAGRPYELPVDLWKQILCFLDVPDLGSCALVSKEISAVTKHDTVWEHHLRKLLRVVFDGAIFLVPKQARGRGFGTTSKPQIRIHENLPKPLLERPLKSTNFGLWYGEWREISKRFTKIDGKDYRVHYKAAVGGLDKSYRGVNWRYYVDKRMMALTELCPDGSWFVEDVPLRTYYREAATFAYHNYRRFRREQKLARLDSDCYEEGVFMPFTSDDEDDCNEELGGHRDGDIFLGLPNIRLFHGLGPVHIITVPTHDETVSRSLYRSYFFDSDGNVEYRYFDDAGRETSYSDFFCHCILDIDYGYRFCDDVDRAYVDYESDESSDDSSFDAESSSIQSVEEID